MAAARGDYGPSLKLLARYGRIRYLADVEIDKKEPQDIGERSEQHDTRVSGLRDIGAGPAPGVLPGMPRENVKHQSYHGAGPVDGVVAEEKEKAADTQGVKDA